MKNYYKILEVSAFADAEVVKSAYRKLARQYHPDLNAGDKAQEEKFKLINEAYDTLGTPDKKALYDESLRVLLNNGQKQQSQGAYKKEASKKAASESPDEPSATPINELFENFIKKGFKEKDSPPHKGTSHKQPHRSKSSEEPIFRTEPKQSGGGTGPAKRGQDVSVETVITPKEAQDGVVKTVHVQHTELCKRCSGTGKVSGGVCAACNGEKAQTRLKKIDVRVPASVKQGSKVRVANEGGRGQGGGENGDLFLNIRIEVDASLRIDGMDVHGEVAVNIPDAVLGRELEVPTLHGLVTMTIPPLTSSGKMLRLKDQGVHSGQLRGDHFVTIRIVAPQSLSSEEKALYEKLARLHQQKG